MASQVLVVDDEAVARNLYSDVLLAAGHRVRAVALVPEALAAFELEPFDVVVTDLIFPGQDGLQLLTELKRRSPDVAVIVVTGLDKVEPAVRALKNGASDYLVKPVAPEVLQSAVARCLLTQRLLAENNALRAHAALMAAGQKLATTLEQGALANLALEALSQELRPSGSALFVQRGNALVIESTRELAEDAARSLLTLLSDRHRELALDHPVELELNGRRVLAFGTREGADVLGALVAVAPARTDVAALSAASFLASHTGLALRTAGRLAAVQDLVYQDDLTGLFNTRYLDMILDRELKAAASTGAPLSLLFMDLDRFKSVNDRHGHLAGSRVLVEVARLLPTCVRDGDAVVRYGGDEFVVMLKGIDSRGAVRVAERIRSTIAQHAFLQRDGNEVRITTSVGAASFPEHATDKTGLLRIADEALFLGKRGSRDVVYLPEPLPTAPPRAGNER